MSAINGDKARFHRRRKNRIARRIRNRQRLASIQGKPSDKRSSVEKGATP